jgi:hypothetical protein
LTAQQVGIDINTTKARKILENISIPIESAILQLVPEGGAQLRKKRFSGHYAELNVEADSTGVYRAFTTSSGLPSNVLVEGVEYDGPPPLPTPSSPDDPQDPFLAFQRSTQRQMDAMNRNFQEQMRMMASLVEVKVRETSLRLDV